LSESPETEPAPKPASEAPEAAAPAAVSSIEDRISFLEEQNSGLKRAGALLCALVVVMGIAMIHESVSGRSGVSTESLIINSTGGKARAALTAMPTGHLGMVFFDYLGRPPADLQYNAIPYLDGFAIYDKDGRPRILIGMDDKDNPILAVVDKDGNTQFTAVEPTNTAPSNNGNIVPPTPPASAVTPTPQVTPTP
jgi:hypothetical protein